MREKLKNLLKNAKYPLSEGYPAEAHLASQLSETGLESIVDYLIANNVIALPCKVGDTVYFINGKFEKQGKKKVYIEFVDKGIADNIVIGGKGIPQIDVCNEENVWTMFDSDEDFGKSVFLTKEDAEQALKGGAE